MLLHSLNKMIVDGQTEANDNEQPVTDLMSVSDF